MQWKFLSKKNLVVIFFTASMFYLYIYCNTFVTAAKLCLQDTCFNHLNVLKNNPEKSTNSDFFRYYIDTTVSNQVQNSWTGNEEVRTERNGNFDINKKFVNETETKKILFPSPIVAENNDVTTTKISHSLVPKIDLKVARFERKKIQEKRKQAKKPDILSKLSRKQYKDDNKTLSDIKVPKLGVDSDLKFLVNTKACKIPWFSPFHPSIRQLFMKAPQTSCKMWTNKKLLYQDSFTIYINWTRVNYSQLSKHFTFCRYSPIIRPEYPKTYDDFKILNESEKFIMNITVRDHEFIKVICYSKRNIPIYWDYFMFQTVRQNVIKRCIKNLERRKERKDIKETLNVLMVGMDSMSKQNSIRYLPKTRKYLLEELGAIELLGYSKVKDNTLVNMIPVLTGKFIQELSKENQAGSNWSRYHFIWDDFMDEGYLSMYVEDAIDISTFGFVKTPTDYFFRHFLNAIGLAKNDKEDKWHNMVCLHDKTETEIALEYVFNYMTNAQKIPHFGYAFTASISHDLIEYSGMTDLPHFNFFKKLKSKGTLDNTILFFFSDHGIRFGPIRETYVGRVEESLPYMFVYIPPYLRTNYPYMWHNLKINSKKLTTPFDFYEALQEILHFNGIERKFKGKKRGYSFFSMMPNDRSCEDAEIDRTYCVCSSGHKESTKSNLANAIAKLLLKEVNKKLMNVKSKCHLLQLKSIDSLYSSNATYAYLDTQINIFKGKERKIAKRIDHTRVYTIVIKTTPGDALFESEILHIVHDKDEKLVSGNNILRINKFKEQAQCLKRENHIYQKYCFCKK